MKPIVFLGDSRDRIRDFPVDARARTGFQLREIQKGDDPNDWKPMTSIGPGAREVRIRAASGAYRVFYLAALEEAVVVLHACQKKTRKTAKRDIDIAAQRLKEWRS